MTIDLEIFSSCIIIPWQIGQRLWRSLRKLLSRFLLKKVSFGNVLMKTLHFSVNICTFAATFLFFNSDSHDINIYITVDLLHHYRHVGFAFGNVKSAGEMEGKALRDISVVALWINGRILHTLLLADDSGISCPRC